MTHGQTFKRTATAARETLAEAEFSLGAVLAACRLRAADGFTWCEIRPSRPLNLKDTAAVQATLAALAKERVRVDWPPVQDRPDLPAYCALRISWDDAESRSG